MLREDMKIRRDLCVILRAWGNAAYLTWWVPYTRLRTLRRDLTIWVLKRKIAKIKGEIKKLGFVLPKE